MQRRKIAVYGIALNEEKHAERWARSAAAADVCIVLDTGSQDRTVELLTKNGVQVVSENITPWRFDVARNRALALVGSDVDICISLDLDEVLPDGWYQAIQNAWTDETTFLRYPFYSEFETDGKVKNVSWGHKVHARHGYHWKFGVHEILRPDGTHFETFTENFRIEHRPVQNNMNANSYHELLIRFCNEEPNEPRYHQYLARSFFDRQEYQKAISEFQKFLTFSPIETASDERSFSWRFISYCHKYLKHSTDEVISCLWKAVAENLHDREAWTHLADEMLAIGNWPNAWTAAQNALALGRIEHSYRVEPDVWNGKTESILKAAEAKLFSTSRQIQF